MKSPRIIGTGGRSYVLPHLPGATTGCAGCGRPVGDPRLEVAHGGDGRRFCSSRCSTLAAPYPYVAEVVRSYPAAGEVSP